MLMLGVRGYIHLISLHLYIECMPIQLPKKLRLSRPQGVKQRGRSDGAKYPCPTPASINNNNSDCADSQLHNLINTILAPPNPCS